MRKQRPVLFATATAIAALCLFSSAGFAAVEPSGDDNAGGAAVAQLVIDAQNATKAGKLQLAIIQLKNASSLAPRNGKVRAQLGIAMIQTGDYYAAERELRQARKNGAPDQLVLPALFQAMLFRHEEKNLLEEFPDSAADMNPANGADIYKAHAVAFQNLGQMAEAAAAMEKSLKLRRDEAGLLTRARIAQQQRDLPGAMAFADEAAKVAPGDVNALLFKFGLMMDANNVNAAMDLSNQLVAKYPDSIPVRFSHVDALMRTNQMAKASAEVEDALIKNPNIAIGIYYRAMLLAKAGDVKGAWRTAQTLPPQFLQAQPATTLLVSQMALSAGATDTAASIISATLARFPQDVNLRLKLASIRLGQNDTAGALNALEPIRDSLDPATAQMLARIYLKAGKGNDALAVLQNLKQSGKGTDATALDIIGLEAQQGQSEQAMKDLAQAVAQKPTNPSLVSQYVMALAQTGRFAEAFSAADKLGSDPKQLVLSLSLRGQVSLAQNNLDAALASYVKALQLEPANPGALYGRAGVLARMKRYGDANKDLNAILAVNPKSVGAYLLLAGIAATQNQDQNVRSALSRAIQQVPQDPAPRVALVRYLNLRKDQKGAVSAANDLVKILPDNAEALGLLGQAQMAAGQKQEAVASFRRVVTLAPKEVASQILLGDALQTSGDRAGATAAMKAAVNLDPNSEQARAAQIRLQLTQGDKDGAVASAQAFQKASPGTPADLILGDTLLRIGRRDQAATVFQQSFAARPNSSTLLRLVSTAAMAGDTKTGADAMSKWLDKNPTDSAIRAQYATLLMQQGDMAKAAAQYQIVLQRDPNNVGSLNNLGWLKRNDDPKRAIQLVTLANKLAPDSPEVMDTLGWLKVQQKQVGEGLPLLKRAHDLRPKDGEIGYHLVMALEASGSHEAAKGLLKAILASGVKFDDSAAANKLAATWH